MLLSSSYKILPDKLNIKQKNKNMEEYEIADGLGRRIAYTLIAGLITLGSCEYGYQEGYKKGITESVRSTPSKLEINLGGQRK